MPSILAGALIPLAAYYWVRDLFGKAAGLAAACILAFSPAMVILSAQVRHYIPHTLFLVCSSYCLERSLREKSVRWMKLFGVSLILAVLTMYMSVWYLAAMGIYVVIRILTRELPKKLIIHWAAIQGICGLIIFTAYFTHLYKLRGNAAEAGARDGWLRPSYFHANSQTAWQYLKTATENLFGYIFSNAAVGKWMILAFALGIILIAAGKGGGRRKLRVAALSLVLPLAMTAAAGLKSIYAYGGTRHDAFLGVFIAAGAAVTIATLAGKRVTVAAAALAVLTPLWLGSAERHYLDEPAAVTKLEQMHSALDYLKGITPKPKVLVVDQIGGTVGSYYICRGSFAGWEPVREGVDTYTCGGYRILTLQVWAAGLEDLKATFQNARAAKPELFPDPAWIFYVSPVRYTDVRSVQPHHAVFGKLEVVRLSP
jgi:uncharacterized membrane protein